MPMFYTPKPRQFHYTPRFYDPEKEKWEELKKKYSMQQTAGSEQEDYQQAAIADNETTDVELAYFEQRVREIENDKKRESQKLGLRDLFRRRKMPTFNYQPRFSASASAQPSSTSTDSAILDKYSNDDSVRSDGYKTRKIKIRRRFDIGDSDYMKPVSAGKIMLYALLACLLLYFILF